MRVTVSTVINRPAEELFWRSQDYSRRLEWDVYLSEAYLLDGQDKAGLGIESFCRNKSGSVLISKYISFSPPTHVAVRMTGGPWVLETFSGTWRFKHLADDRTEARFLYSFKCRPTLLRWLIEPIIGRVYKYDMRRRLAAFKAWAEEGADR